MGGYRLLSCAVMIFISVSVFASEEAYVSWNRVKIESNGYPVTGAIAFEAGVDGEKWTSVSISVFGKKYDLSAGDIARLRGYPLNSLVITHEAGYPQLGGHTVHFKLSYKYYNKGKLLEKRLYLSISKGKGLNVHEVEARK